MGDRPLSSLKLPPATIGALARAGYTTVEDIQATSAEALSKELRISMSTTQGIYAASQAQRAPPLTQSAAVLIGDMDKKISTLCRPLDTLLEGGIRRGSIVEISGPPGSAKETLAENVTRSFVEENEGVLFVDMQNMTSADKLRESLRKSTNLPPRYEALVQYLTLYVLSNLMIFLNQLPTFLNSHPKPGLLVLNSLSFPFQNSGGLSYSARNTLLERLKNILAKTCATTSITVLITTQLATKLLTADGSAANFETGSRAILLPQLGSTYLPSGNTYRVMIVPHTRNTGVLRLLSTPSHGQSQKKQPLRDEAYEIIEGVVQ